MRSPRRPLAPARRAALALAAAVAVTLAVAVPADAATYPGPGGITIPSSGTGNPYPSSITVSDAAGAVTSVEVTLTGLSHTFPSDLVIVLQGPQGQGVALSSACGDSDDLTNATLRFADAGTPLPSSAIASGTYSPTVCTVRTSPAPAPATPGTQLSTFAGTDANGTWNLYVFDEYWSDSGSLTAWSLDIESGVTADAGGPYTIAEGAGVQLDASASVAGPWATYAWDLDGDGIHDDATGVTPTVAPATLAALGMADGPAGPMPVSLQVTVGADVTLAASTLTTTATAPTATVALPGQVLADTPFTMTVGAVDPSPADAAATFTYEIDWTGDGVVDQTLTGPADPPVTHTYATAGTYRVTVWATDRDGSRSAPLAVDVVVLPALAASGGVPDTAWLAAAALALGGLLLAAGHRLRRPVTSAR